MKKLFRILIPVAAVLAFASPTGARTAAVTQNGSMDYSGGNREMSFGYNVWGALVKDESHGISDISYDRFGNPLRVSFSDGSYTENVYSATGEKLRMTHVTSLNGTVIGKAITEYRGNVIYRDGKVYMVLFAGGYATIDGTAVTFHYYTQDYLGNNRAVINGSTGAIEQLTAYYPYGGVIADLGTNQTTGQPYRFGGKELITANGLNEYDFGARQYYTAIPGFTRIDPLCEKYYWLSPYLYCGNNSVNAVDPTGKIVISLDEQARQSIIYSLTEEEAKFIKFNDDGVIDADILSQSSSNSENMESLRTVVNSETFYYVATASQSSSGGRTRELKEHGKVGTAGVTLMPNAPDEPSPDNNVYIYTSSRLPIIQQVENLTHELYGHGYFYELNSKGFDVNPFHDYRSVMVEGDLIPGYDIPECVSTRVDFNTGLDNQINIVT